MYGNVVRYKDKYTVHLSLVVRLFGLRLLWSNAPCEFTPTLNLRSLALCFNSVWLAVFYAKPLFFMGM